MCVQLSEIHGFNVILLQIIVELLFQLQGMQCFADAGSDQALCRFGSCNRSVIGTYESIQMDSICVLRFKGDEVIVGCKADSLVGKDYVNGNVRAQRIVECVQLVSVVVRSLDYRLQKYRSDAVGIL